MRRYLALLLTLGLGMHSAFAQKQEIFTKEDKNQILSSIKDVEITDTLKKTREYSDCAEKYPFEAAADAKRRSTNLASAQKCFEEKIGNTTDPKKLEELSNKLGLQQYGLVQSNSQKEIQGYLNDKLYEALTGVNRKEKKDKELLESMKFKNMKQVDQSVFIQLYKNQLGKNALAEISTFCFEKLRLNNVTDNQFDKHWATYKGLAPISVSTVNDLGAPAFTTFSDTKDTSTIYKEIFESIQGTFDEQKLSNFFVHCGELITPLCEKFKQNQNENNTNSMTDSTTSTNGAAACLTQARIQDYKKSIAAADLLIDDFKTLTKEQTKGLMLQMDGAVNIYGKGAKDKGIDELTNLSSSDLLLNSGASDEQEKLEQECSNNNQEACDAFAISGDSLDKAKHNIELQMTLKRDVEKKRVALLKNKNDGSLEEYLRANGFMYLLENDKYKTVDIEKEIGLAFEAKKAALLIEINNKLGSRQIKKGDNAAQIKAKQDIGITDSKFEKARMTQVVLFHNIISSFLTLEREGDANSKGRNVEAWNIEADGLVKSKIDEKYFSNIKLSNEKAQKIDSKNTSMDFKLLDQFLK